MFSPAHGTWSAQAYLLKVLVCDPVFRGLGC